MAEQEMSEEQVAELKEKIKNMSPEELREFQKKQCIFCHIVEGKVQSKKIFEDDKALAVLDINPANPGHILLMPKEHYSIMPQIPENVLQHLFMLSKSLSNAALRGLSVQGVNILIANGVAAGQKANHFMIHIIPRKEDDGINFELPQKQIDEKTLTSIRDKLTAKIASLTGTKPVMASPKPVVEAEFKEEPKEEKEEREVQEQKKDEKLEDALGVEEPKEEDDSEQEEPEDESDDGDSAEEADDEGNDDDSTVDSNEDSGDNKGDGVSLDDISRLLG